MMVKVPISLMEDIAKMLDKNAKLMESGDVVSWSAINQTLKLSKLIKDNYTEIKAPHDSID